MAAVEPADERAECIAWANANGFPKYHESMCAAWEERARRAAASPAAEALTRHECNALNEAVKQLPSISALRTLRDKLFAAAPQPAQADAPAEARAKSISDEMMDLVDRLGSEWKDVDPRAWQHLLVYAPAEAREPITREAMLAAIDEFELVCDNNLARDLSPDEKFAVSEFVIDFFENAPTAMLSANREIWEYSYIHSSALGRGDEKIGPCLTYEKATAFDVGCIEQRLVACAPADAGEAVPVAYCRRDTVLGWKGQIVNVAWMFPSPYGLKDPIALYTAPPKVKLPRSKR
ncbi:hypothetical protein AQ914_25795 [Burkholderia pseudomallei]|nr:hypothetical protein AQ914_25795 [Burkholderia pseudomallei]